VDRTVTRRAVLAGSAALFAAACAGGSDRRPASDGSLVALDDLKVGESARIALDDDKKVVVTRTGEQTAVAFDATCTHLSCLVAPRDGQLRCPCHGSAFDPKTGAVTNGPAARPLPEVAVTVRDGKVFRA
jgi:Rieske Fe-S protein